MITIFIIGIVFAVNSVRAARNLHQRAAASIMRAPVSFYDTTPMGRVINRFSKDMDAIDTLLSDSLRMFSMTLFTGIGSLVFVIYATPFFGLAIVPLLALYYFIQQVYRHTARELKRIDSVSRSPLYAHYGETMNGIATIRAYKKTDEFTALCASKLDKYEYIHLTNFHSTIGPNFILLSSQRWLSVRLELVGALIVFFATTFGVLARFSVSSSVLGLSVSYAIQVTGVLSWCVRQFAEAEVAMNAVERVNGFGTELDSEAEPVLENSRPPKSWPDSGKVVFEKVDVRYRKETPLVLKNVSLTVEAQTKVGIVGRTGSGKSTIANALFRIMELDNGSITIDGIDAAKIGLEDLRKNLSIIPQDPVLFSGTFRSNLDPFNEHQEVELWHALSRASLKRKVESEGGLEAPVSEGGGNLSIGEAQLLCLARALLKKSKILVMDEATANVDMDTDAIIQGVLREDFKDCTIICVAHRLNTIIDYDRVAVLDHGEVKEYGSPKQLLAQQGEFAALVAETGSENESLLRSLAK